MSNRPTYYGQETNTIFRKFVETQLKTYLEEDDVSEESVEDMLDALSFEQDPYRATRSLDDNSWNADSSLYDVVDNLITKKFEAHKQAIENWVSENKLMPKHSIGDVVKFSSSGKEHTGKIVSIYDKRAEYCIFCEEMGHVKSGIGSLGIIIPYESVT